MNECINIKGAELTWLSEVSEEMKERSKREVVVPKEVRKHSEWRRWNWWKIGNIMREEQELR